MHMPHKSCGPRRIRVLVKAFGAFPGAPQNPTGELARELLRRHGGRLARLGIDLEVHLLPVRYAAIAPVLEGLLASGAPEAVLHLGLAGRRKMLSVETRARNRLSPWRPDATHRLPEAARVVAGAPESLAARWPAARVRTAMAAHVPAALSIDAGDYVCNQTLFLSLWRSRIPAGFIHVPLPRGRGRGAAGRVSLAAMVEAVASATLVLAKEIRLGLTGGRAAAIVRAVGAASRARLD
jgi:pyroglutamyl-peptidase